MGYFVCVDEERVGWHLLDVPDTALSKKSSRSLPGDAPLKCNFWLAQTASRWERWKFAVLVSKKLPIALKEAGD